MGFFRKEVIDFALDQQAREAIEAQRAWIAAEPSNPRPYQQLALLYRMHGQQQEEALGLLLEAVRLDPNFAAAHVSLAEIYAVRDDREAAQRHAELAAAHGDQRALEMLRRHGLVDPQTPSKSNRF
jgi:tetratricopeptide (TPR) repeat protein